MGLPRSNVTMEMEIWVYQGVYSYGEGDMGLPRSNIAMEREIWVYQGVM